MGKKLAIKLHTISELSTILKKEDHVDSKFISTAMSCFIKLLKFHIYLISKIFKNFSLLDHSTQVSCKF